eukprot:scaffold20645_cov97-Isochrysis_galbana.AAC.2
MGACTARVERAGGQAAPKPLGGSPRLPSSQLQQETFDLLTPRARWLSLVAQPRVDCTAHVKAERSGQHDLARNFRVGPVELHLSARRRKRRIGQGVELLALGAVLSLELPDQPLKLAVKPHHVGSKDARRLGAYGGGLRRTGGSAERKGHRLQVPNGREVGLAHLRHLGVQPVHHIRRNRGLGASVGHAVVLGSGHYILKGY